MNSASARFGCRKHRTGDFSSVLLIIGMMGCADLVGADFDVHPGEPSPADTGVAAGNAAGGKLGMAAPGNEAGRGGGDATVGGQGPSQAGAAGEPSEPPGGAGPNGASGDSAAAGGGDGGDGGAAGAPDPGACNSGTLVTLPSSERVCDCPSGTWGAHCEVLSESIALGTQRCVLRSDKRVSCWGFDYGNPAPEGLEAKSLSAGLFHTCAVDLDGKLQCWGNDSYVSSVPEGVFAEVSSQLNQSCVLDEAGYPTCIGYGVQAPAQPLLQIQSPGEFGCGLWLDGSISIWGSSLLESATPVGPFVSIAASLHQLCGITAEHELRCTLSSDLGKAPGGLFEKVVIGNSHGCAIHTDGTISCWGSNAHGEREAPAGQFKDVAVGNDNSCAVRNDGSVTCWGELMEYTEGGPPSGVFTAVENYGGNVCAIKVNGSLLCWGFPGGFPSGAFKQASPGADHGCGVKSDDRLLCWGNNDHGQATPPTNGKFRRVSSGHFFSCALRSDDKVKCWGIYTSQQLDAPDDDFIDISVGQTHACGVREDGTLSCWGEQGVLTKAPTGSYQRVYANGWHTCALRSDGAAVCWGKADDDYLNRGQMDAPEGSHFVELAVAPFHSCGRTAEGAVECWGENEWGESDSRVGPFTSINAGYSNTCGVHANGRMECWGATVRPLQ